MTKQENEKTVTKDKLVGMTVIDSNGDAVGTVKDVGFTIGKAGISLNVEGKDGGSQNIAWDDVQAAGDFVLLKAATVKASKEVKPATSTQPAQSGETKCPTCKGQLSYIQQYQRWYCYKCQKYV